jgi:hypothetical protein
MKFLLLFLLMLFIPVCGFAKDDPKGSATKTFDAKGKLLQKTNDNGRHYDPKGHYQGKTTADGKHYDAKGKFTGKTIQTPTGTKSYDAKGKLLQKTDARGRIYDAKGKYQGKVKSIGPARTEKRNAQGKLVEVKKAHD